MWTLTALLLVAHASVPPTFIPSRNFIMKQVGGYENYAFTGYENYKTIRYPYVTSKRPIYDPMGDFLMRGIDVYSWIERRGEGWAYTRIRKPTVYRTIFDYVIIGSDSWGSSSGKIIVANEIRTKFTPLTFNQAQFNGIRADIATEDDRASFILSRFTRPIFAGRYSTGEGFYPPDMGLLLGGHWERQVGVMTLGATFYNAHTYDRMSSPGEGDFVRGTINQNIPVPMIVAVRVSDDSPEDGTGPVVFDVRVYINGRIRPDVRPDVIKRDSRQNYTAIWEKDPSDPTGKTFRRKGQYALFVPAGYFQWNRERFRGWEYPLYADYLYRMDIERGEISPEEIANPADPNEMLRRFQLVRDFPMRADGYDVLMFYLDLSRLGEDYISSVRMDLLIGNDYRIDISTIGASQSLSEKSFYKKGYTERYQPSYYQLVRRAPGNVKDLSNVGWVRVEIGHQTGLTVRGLNFHANFRGLEVNAEYASSTLYFQYPDGRPAPQTEDERKARQGNIYSRKRLGGRWKMDGKAYYLNLHKEGRRFGFGFEYFYMGPYYTTTIVTYNSYAGAGVLSSRQFAPWDFVEDNDDNDRFPDLNSPDPVPGIGSHGYEPDGVFPGKDEDKDGIPDTNRNGNDLPDYVEPFLMYYVEPDEYAYGRDMNNNGVIDVREDDRKPEYPYDPDRKGYHVYLRLSPTRFLSLTLGRLDSREVAGGGVNKVNYAKLTLNVAKTGMGRVFAELKLKDVRDDIRDDVFKYSEKPGGVYDPMTGYGALYKATYTEDPLDYRDSFVRTMYISADVTPVQGLNFHASLKEELNDQRWLSDRVGLTAAVSRMDYTFCLGGLEVTPAFKLQWLKKTRKSTRVPLMHEVRLVPILRLKYQLAPKVAIRFGAQGFPGLEHRFLNFTEGRKNFREKTYILDFVSSSEYWGYKVWMNFGLKFEQKEFDDPFRKVDNVKYASYFARVVLSY